MMNTLKDLIEGAVQDMMIDHCLACGIEPETGEIMFFQATLNRKDLLGFSEGIVCSADNLVEVIGDDVFMVEKRCFGLCNGSENQMVNAAEKAIEKLLLATLTYFGSYRKQSD